MNISRSSIKLFTSRLAISFTGYIGLIYFSQELGAAEIGLFFLFQSTVRILQLPTDLGIGQAAQKRISEGEDMGEYFATASLMKFLPITVIGLALFIASDYINSYFGRDIVLYLIIACLLYNFSYFSIEVLRGELRVEKSVLPELARKVSWLCFGAILLHWGFGVLGLIYGWLIGLAITMIWGFVAVSLSPRRPTVEHARSLLDFSKFGFISSIGGTFYSYFDLVIIGLFLTKSHVGAYEIAWRISITIVMFGEAITATVFPQISSWDAEGAKNAIEDLLPEAFGASLSLAIPGFFGALVFSEDILSLIFGPEFVIAWIALIILTGEKVFHGIHMLLEYSLLAIDKPKLAAKASIVSVVCNILLNLVLIYYFGLMGAAFATTFAMLVNMMMHYVYLSRFIDVEFPHQNIGWAVVSSVIMAICLFGVKSAMTVDSVFVLIALIMMGALIYGAVLLIYKPIRVRFYNNVKPLYPSTK